jgi:hypothetical protein
MAVQLVGRTDPLWTVNAYIVWNNEYLYVAVNESVPATTGYQSWIEFAIDPGPTSTYRYVFAIFDDHALAQMRSQKPSSAWSGMSVSFIAASVTAAEFRIKYTDFGASFGDTIKLAIDRNQGPAPPPPYGFAAFWPQNAIIYGSPNVPDPTTWGDVPLQPTLYITPPLTMKQFADVGDTFEVTVMADEMTDLFGFDFNITWDNTLITFDHASYVNNLIDIWGPTRDTDWSVTNYSAAEGCYRFVALSLNNGYTGSHSLLTLGFLIQDPHTNWKKQTALHFHIDKLSNSAWQPIIHTTTDATYEIYGSTPALDLSPTSKTCRKINEEFDVAITISNGESVTGFDFEIDYDTTLLDYVSATINYGTGTITPDDANGKITGFTTGSASGSMSLVTIRFKAAYNHIWKDELTVSGWHNIVTGSIYIQSATLHYPLLQPDRSYTRGGSGNTINVGDDFTYTWSPIQGDVDLDGDVDVFDLRTVSAFYDATNDTWNLTGSTNSINIFDLIVIAGNFGFKY